MKTLGKIITAATLLLTTAAVLTSKETVLLNSEVSARSIAPLVKELNNNPILDPFRGYHLVLNSPGGLVLQEQLLIEMMKSSGRKITTEVPVFAASAAASLFLHGKERVMHKGAVLVIHEVRVPLSQDLVMTYSDAKSILEHGKLAPNSSLKGERLGSVNLLDMLIGGGVKGGKDSKDDGKTIVDDIKERFGDKLKELVAGMEKDHLKDIQHIMLVTGLTKATVEKEILISNVDNYISADKALELGLATEIK